MQCFALPRNPLQKGGKPWLINVFFSIIIPAAAAEAKAAVARVTL